VYRFSRCATNFIGGRGCSRFCGFNRSHYLILYIFGCSLKIICCGQKMSFMFEGMRCGSLFILTLTVQPLFDDQDFRSSRCSTYCGDAK
jgi:hypothetical protein